MTDTMQTNKSHLIRQAMILAAGKGTRMRPLTLTTPKPLIDVAGQPLIVWHIKALKAAGISDITINCSWLADKLMGFLGDGTEFGVKIHWSLEAGEPLETAGGIAKALVDGKLRSEPFILVNGDVWTTFDFARLINNHSVISRQVVSCQSTNNVNSNKAMLAHLLLIDNPQHNPTGDFFIKDGLALTKEKGSQTTNKAHTFSGISLINPTLLDGVSLNQPYALAPLLREAMKQGRVSAEHTNDTWIDVGTPERLQAVNQFVINQNLSENSSA